MKHIITIMAVAAIAATTAASPREPAEAAAVPGAFPPGPAAVPGASPSGSSSATLPVASDSTASEATPADVHIAFEDMTLQGDIYQFADTLKHHGFHLDKRMRDVDSFLFHGTIAGTSCYFQVSYTPTSRTVYRIMAQPKHVNINAYVDSLSVRYGELFDSKPGSYQWMTPGGAVLLMTPDGMDPTLVIIDAQGYATFKEERDAPKIR